MKKLIFLLSSLLISALICITLVYLFPESRSNILVGFITSVIASLAGAGFGSYSAIQLSKNENKKDKLASDINLTNHAIVVTSGLVVNYLSYKRNVTSYFLENFNDAKAEFERYIIYKETRPPEDFHSEAGIDLRSFEFQPNSATDLKEIAMKIGSLEYTTLADIYGLIESQHQFMYSVRSRENFINHHRKLSESLDDESSAKFLFGMEYDGTKNDTTMKDSLTGMQEHISNMIYYSYSIYDRLLKQGYELINQYKKLDNSALLNIVKSKHVEEAFKNGDIPTDISPSEDN